MFSTGSPTTSKKSSSVCASGFSPSRRTPTRSSPTSDTRCRCSMDLTTRLGTRSVTSPDSPSTPTSDSSAVQRCLTPTASWRAPEHRCGTSSSPPSRRLTLYDWTATLKWRWLRGDSMLASGTGTLRPGPDRTIQRPSDTTSPMEATDRRGVTGLPVRVDPWSGRRRLCRRSGAYEHFECLPVGHGSIPIRHVLKADRPVEHPAGINRAVEHIGQQLVDVGPGRCDPTGHGQVAHEHADTHGELVVLGGTDPADDATVTHHGKRRVDRILQTGALQHGVGAIAPGQLAHLLHTLLAALGDHVRRTELAAKIGARLVPAHENDPLGPEPFGSQHRRQAHSSVTDHGDRRPRIDPGHDGAVVARGEDVGQGHEGREQGGVLADRQLDQGALSLRHAHRLALAAVDTVATPESTVPTGGLPRL